MAEKSYFKLGGKTYKLDLENNRSLFGDTVVIELADRSEWRRKFKKISEDDDNEDMENKLSTKFQSEQQIIDMNLIQYLQQNPDLVPKGKIVAIHKRNLKSYCGSLNLANLVFKSSDNKEMVDEDNEKLRFEIYEFIPVDTRFPSFYMRTFNVKALEKKRIMVDFDEWPRFSNSPLCHFVRVIGD